MSQSITLTKLFNLSNGFYVALGHRTMTDHELLSKELEADAANNHATVRLVGKVFDLATEEEEKKALINGEELDAVSDALALGAIEANESIANLFLKFMDEKELSAFVPEQNRSAEASTAFAANNAPTLAKLFAPKAP